MSSRFYLIMFAILGACSLFSLGTMFGLGIVTEPAPPSRIDTAISATPRVVHKPAQSDEAKRIADRELSPIYPASPGGVEPEKKSAERSTTGAAETASADASKPEESKPEQQDKAEPAAVTQSARAEPAIDDTGVADASTDAEADHDRAAAAEAGRSDAKSAKNESPAKIESAKAEIKPRLSASAPTHANSCDVQACSAAYKSFRESDCTYQPYDGPRRLCANPPAPEQQRASEPRDRPVRSAARDHDDADDLRAAVEEVRRMTRGPEYYDRGPYAPSRPPAPVPGRRVIIVQPY